MLNSAFNNVTLSTGMINQPTDKATVQEGSYMAQNCTASEPHGHISQLYRINVIYFIYYVEGIRIFDVISLIG